jgi:uncharacterized membrane protein
MPFGLLTGLGAALSWGTMDIASALSSRLIGSLRVTAAVQLICAGFLVVATIVTGTSIPSDLTTLSMAALLGVIGAGAYFAYFTGLRIGPISVVSGMVAAYGGLTVVLSVVFRGESLTLTQAVGAAVATGGVIVTGVSFGGSLRATRFAGPGVVFAVVALVLFALMAITMDVALEAADWLQVLVVSRLVIGLVCIVGIVWVAIARGRAAPATSRAEGTGQALSARFRSGASRSCSSWPVRSTRRASCRSRSGSRTHRLGWSGLRRRSVPRSRSSWRSPSSANGSRPSSGSGSPASRSGWSRSACPEGGVPIFRRGG